MATLVSQIIILLKSVGMLPSAPNGSRILPRYISGQAIAFLSQILWKDRSKFGLKILEHLYNEGIWVFVALFPHLGAEGDVAILAQRFGEHPAEFVWGALGMLQHSLGLPKCSREKTAPGTALRDLRGTQSPAENPIWKEQPAGTEL